ncbi:MAG: hypothetical protein FWG02_00275 [Holophagaceae bacterium]|nr:hypothetical protein [Holophagaceae bacterium]
MSVLTHTFLALLLAVPVFCQSSSQIMPVSEIRIGMQGHGLTVFKGSKIERFEFEVLGVEKNSMPGRDRILVMASGGPLANSGILAGMSGSPCYINGKLIGALSTGFSWGKDPIAGITPIQEMLDQLMDVPDTISARTPLIPPRLDPARVVRSAQLGEMIPLSDLISTPETTKDEQVIPLVLHGIAPSRETKGWWDGIPVVFAGHIVGDDGQAIPSPIEPGGMVAIPLITGDLNAAASGTITYVSGKRVLLLGHQLGNLGVVDFPLWSASVSTHVARYDSSMKLAQPIAPIGAVRLDRPTGVTGVIGAEPKTIPFRVGLNLGGKRNINFSFDVLDHPLLTPGLVSEALAQTIISNVRESGMQSLSLQGNIKLANQQPLVVENMSADINSMRLPMYLGAMLQAICLNPFERPIIEGISINIKGEERLDLTAIVGVRPLVARVKRGQTMQIQITMQNFQGVRETTALNVPVPLSAKPGKAMLQVGDGLSILRNDPDSQKIRTTSLAEMVLLLNGTLKNNYAYAFLSQEQEGAGLRGNRIEGIPPSISSLLLLDGDTSDNRLQRHVIGRAALALEREVTGLITLEIEIE